ncbi:uncharacterized protein THITE_2132160 [Thermothielavioides terrestris NRRL 8126]|uniref:Uncharacterized protein n=1 Tax=Thermothielavioides terrestris (strain ATCC 38088 / NRRL 8126) TaxID=578455 RepID=G2RD25_THETT|nr:uncharacterized protein THITE_2132160 [Thermothielavioides terrestris NRRL 8126]AEO70718.1 hypothetical protein THITE_2132160 [Thermothielavioides terrestris NRRL 8126]
MCIRGCQAILGIEACQSSAPRASSQRKRAEAAKSTSDSWGDTIIPILFKSFEIATNGVKNIVDGYNTFRNAQVHRAETKVNGQAMRGVVPDMKAFLRGLSTYVKQRNVLEPNIPDGSQYYRQTPVIHGELEAQTGLEAPRKFARQVDMTIREQMASTPSGSTRDIFFLYHPDTDRHGEFFDTRSVKRARFHLIIPAYRPMLIIDPLIFPEELYPLTIRGLVHNSQPLVWFDLPTAAPVVGVLAGSVWLGGSAGAFLGGAAVGDRVEKLFDRPVP